MLLPHSLCDELARALAVEAAARKQKKDKTGSKTTLISAENITNLLPRTLLRPKLLNPTSTFQGTAPASSISAVAKNNETVQLEQMERDVDLHKALCEEGALGAASERTETVSGTTTKNARGWAKRKQSPQELNPVFAEEKKQIGGESRSIPVAAQECNEVDENATPKRRRTSIWLNSAFAI